MIKFLLTFGAGLYAGVYLSQNYEVPRVDDPQALWAKIKSYAEEHRKSPDTKE
jgi:hypothetical protein